MKGSYLDRMMHEVILTDMPDTVIPIFYFPEDNRFIDVFGEVIYNVFEMITPNDLYLFQNDPDQKEFRHRSIKDAIVQIIDMEDNGYEESYIDPEYRACSRRACRFSNLEGDARKEVCRACGGADF